MAEGSQRAEALWYVAPGKVEIRPQAVGVPSAGEVRVRALFSAVSRGTERLIFSGGVPESEFERMRAPNMEGAFPFPVKYGYAMVGRAEGGSPELSGKPVFALYPHQTAFNLEAEKIVPLPAGLPPRRAVLAANMETALNAVWDAGPARTDRIAVVGAGVLGLLVAWACRKVAGAAPALIDIDPSRAEVAGELGLAFALPDAAPRDCDLVIHTSASEAGLATSLDLAGNEATVLELSWYGTNDVRVPLGGAFHARRLKLISSQVGQVAPSRRAHWSYRDRLIAALNLLASDPALDTLLAPAVKFADLPARLPDILTPKGGVLCQVIDYGQG